MPDISPSHFNVGCESFPSPLQYQDAGPEPATPWSVPMMKMHANAPLRRPSAVSEKFLLPEHQRPTVQHDDFTNLEIPIIDLAAYDLEGDESAMETVVAQVRDACLNWGFFQIINHGVEEEILSRVQSQANRLFSLPYSDKMKVQKQPGKYSGYGHVTAKEGDIRPWSEGFYFSDEKSAADHAQQLWPEGNNDFVDSYKEYCEKVKHLSSRVMRIIVAGLEADPAHFEKYTTDTGGLLRWNFYPACPEPLKTIGLTAHTDFNLLTVLHQGEIGGLQIQKDGKWIAVRPRPGALAVNIGDTLQVLTNAKYKSVPHRAVVNTTRSRISLVYFWVPLTTIDIVPSPDLVDANNPCKYKPFNFETLTKTKQMSFLNTLDHFLREE
ncbi:hypothetical protein KC19_6G070100 [Ceratodon purpureus]|uniref:Fe2OG dioxygenase domain-containing protein n=1 Tax=Ceratodon purpureus TaxID=3225 RepID=A0A8T0HFU4_CERPU|nr:hypothetical protein KC19_6G070100 [Ceratodon purpureus]